MGAWTRSKAVCPRSTRTGADGRRFTRMEAHRSARIPRRLVAASVAACRYSHRARSIAAIGVLAALGVIVPLALRAQSDQINSPEAQIRIADQFFSQGRYDEARAAYRPVALTEGPIATRAAAGLVLSVLRAGDFLGAYAEAETFRRAKPDESLVAAVFGDALWAVGRFEEAERAYESALRVDGSQPRGHHGRARSLAATGRFGEAVRAIQEALRLTPGEPEFHHTAATIYERMHRYADAAAALREYLNLMPPSDRGTRAPWIRAEIRFLESFNRRPPLEIEPPKSAAADAPAEQVWRVPIRIRRDKVLVRGSVNGGSQDFVLDTGAEQTVISRDIARLRGVAPISYVQSAGVGEAGARGLPVGRIDTLQIGSLKIRNVPCLIKSPAVRGLPSRETESFSPLALGLSMRLDYEQRELIMGRNLPVEPYDQELPMRMHRLAMVPGIVNGSPASFVIDTGGEVISISDATAGQIRHEIPFRRIPLKVYGASGWDREAFLMPNVNIEFSRIRFDRIPVVVLNLKAPSALLGFQLGGIVGHRFLSKYRVTIDLDRSVVGLDAS